MSKSIKRNRSYDDLKGIKLSYTDHILEQYEQDTINTLDFDSIKYNRIIYQTLIKYGFIEKNKSIKVNDIPTYISILFSIESENKIDSFITEVLLELKEDS